MNIPRADVVLNGDQKVHRNGHEMESQVKNICCIGAGYVGGLTATVIASENPEIDVHVVDVDQDRITAWMSDNPPVNEPGLEPILRISRDGDSTTKRRANLQFSVSIDCAIKRADMIIVAVNTPPKETGRGAHQALDISYVEASVEAIARAATSDKIVVVKSTVPSGTADTSIKRILQATANPNVKFTVLSNPEFLAEGSAIHNLLHPDRVLIGLDHHDPNTPTAAKALAKIYSSWIPHDRIMFMSTRSAELTKLAANALLAQRISSINAISAICEKTGADVEEVALACGLDTRIGPHMLKASLGFGGSCLQKDVLTLAHFADDLDLTQVGSYWRSIAEINEFQKSRFSRTIVQVMNNTLARRHVTVLGCAFKVGTSDVRESPGVSLIADLLVERAHVTVYDPDVQMSTLIDALSRLSRLNEVSGSWRAGLEMVQTSVYEACDGAHAIVVATERDEYSAHSSLLTGGRGGGGAPARNTNTTKVDWIRIARGMRHPKLVFDGRNVVDGRELAALGLRVYMVGKMPFEALDVVS